MVKIGRTINESKKGGTGRGSARRLVNSILYVCLLGYSYHLGKMSSFISDSNNNPIDSINRHPTGATVHEEVPVFDFPATVKDVIINVGSNIDPVMLAEEYGPCARTIAVEPVAGCEIKKHPQVSVLHAAVSEKAGILSMRMYNKHGVSSSLAKPSATMDWNNPKKWKRNGELRLVPVVTLSSILYAVPKDTKIQMLMTDIQGYDFAAIKAAGPALLERVSHMVTEVWLDDVHTYDVENDLCRDFLPFMTELGYTLVHLREGLQYTQETDVSQIPQRCANQIKARPTRPAVNETVGLKEADAFWVQKDAVGQEFPKYAKLPQHKPKFTAKDYEECGI